MITVLAGKALSVLLVPFGWVLAWAMDVDLDWDDEDHPPGVPPFSGTRGG